MPGPSSPGGPTPVGTPYEPQWLRNLQEALNTRDHVATVNVDDLRMAVGACGHGPGGEALIGVSEDGVVCVDFQKLIKAVYFTPDEADGFADVIERHAAALRARATAVRESGRPCGCDPAAGWICEVHRTPQEVKS